MRRSSRPPARPGATSWPSPRPAPPSAGARGPTSVNHEGRGYEVFAEDLKRDGFAPIDPISILLTHLSKVIRNNLAQLQSYKDMRALLDRLDPEYKRLIDDICPAHISQSELQAVLKLLLAERVSIRNLNLILEAVAEIAP